MVVIGEVALLSFPVAPVNGQYFPIAPPAGVNIYQWSSPDQTWRLIGPSTGVTAGTYGDSRNVPQFTVDATGRISLVQNVAISAADWTLPGQLVVGTGAGTQATLNAGTDTSILVVDTTTATNLAWSDSSTSAVLLPAGPTLNRPTAPVAGQIRYNDTTEQFEGYQGTPLGWGAFSTLPTGGLEPGGSLEQIFFLNDQVVFANYTVPSTKNAMSAGPIVINAGTTVTISPGATWAII